MSIHHAQYYVLTCIYVYGLLTCIYVYGLHRVHPPPSLDTNSLNTHPPPYIHTPKTQQPTNHLDIPAKEILEEACRNYDGAILLVSHDRYFVSQVRKYMNEYMYLYVDMCVYDVYVTLELPPTLGCIVFILSSTMLIM